MENDYWEEEEDEDTEAEVVPTRPFPLPIESLTPGMVIERYDVEKYAETTPEKDPDGYRLKQLQLRNLIRKKWKELPSKPRYRIVLWGARLRILTEPEAARHTMHSFDLRLKNAGEDLRDAAAISRNALTEEQWNALQGDLRRRSIMYQAARKEGRRKLPALIPHESQRPKALDQPTAV
jgi:hypothetical protein